VIREKWIISISRGRPAISKFSLIAKTNSTFYMGGGDDVKRMETIFGFSLFYIIVLSFRRAATIRPERKQIGIDYCRRNWTACVLPGSVFRDAVIRSGGDDRKRDRSDRAIRSRLNGCRSGKYREAESSPSLRSIAVAAIARDSRKLHYRLSWRNCWNMRRIRRSDLANNAINPNPLMPP